MSLVLHAGAEPIDYPGLRNLKMPEATETHVPIPHFHVVDIVRHMLSFYGHVVTEEHHGITKDGDRYFGVLSLKSAYGDYTDMLGLRNSHDKSMPIGLAFGSRVFVCDNMAFVADHVIRRKHTMNAKHELPALISAIVEPLAAERERQHEKLLAYQGTALSDKLADHLALELYRQDVLNIQRVPEVLSQWQEPSHDWGDKTAWRFFNAVTFALAGRIADNPSSTATLHAVIDSACEIPQLIH